jgi:streptogramin lyase
MRIRHLLGAGIALVLSVGSGVVAPASANDASAPEFSEISPLPLEGVTAPGSQVGPGPEGQPWIYYVSSGSPAVLSVVDARTGERQHEFSLPGGAGSWAVDVTENGDVYIGTYSEGRLFRWVPGASSIEDLGQQVAGEHFIWSLTHDEQGRVYGGTGQAGAHVFQYDPATGQTRDYGSLSGDQNLLVRSVSAYDGAIYAGTGAIPAIYEIDIDTGERHEIPIPEQARDRQYVYDLDVRDGLLFARFSQSGSPEPLYVYDIASGVWIDEISDAHGLFLSPIADDGRSVYFVREETLYVYDLDSRTYSPTALTGISDVRGFGFLSLADGSGQWPGRTLVAADYQGGYWLFNPQSGASDERRGDVAGTAAPVRSMTTGPDGKIYFGSFLAGGLASFDPQTGEKAGFAPEVGQGSGMTTHDGALWVGTYPYGEIYRYDPDQPDETGVNPEPVLRLYDYGQSRPMALASAGQHLAIGTIAQNGASGGGLTLLNTETGEHWFTDVIPGHSVVGLAYLDGVLYGSTSVYGGAGAPDPTHTDAYVFAYDIESRSLLWKIAPIAGEGAFGEIVFDDEGHLWTHSPVSVVEIDPAARTVLATRTYEEYPWESVEHAWVGSRLWIDPYTGAIDVVTQAKAFSIDPVTLERVRWFRPASYGIFSDNGKIYLARDTTAWEYMRPAGEAATVSVSEANVHPGDDVIVSLEGFGQGELVEIFASGRSLGLRQVSEDGTLGVPVHVAGDADAGERQVLVARPGTRTQLSASYEIVPRACDETITGTHRGQLTISRGVTCLSGEVTGPVTVGAGASLVATDAAIRGPLRSNSADVVVLTGTTTTGPVHIDGTAGTVELRGGSVHGPVSLSGNHGSVVLAGNDVRGSLACSGNVREPDDEGVPNRLTGPATGQCAALG